MTAITHPPAAPAARRPRGDSRGAAIALRVRRLLAAIGRILAALVPVFLLGSLFTYALGALAFGPAAIDSLHCDEAARGFARQWLHQLPRICR